MAEKPAKKGIQTREKILEEALDRFGSSGIDATSLD